MAEGKGLINTRRRLSAPGRRKSEGIVLKPENSSETSRSIYAHDISFAPVSAKRARHSTASTSMPDLTLSPDKCAIAVSRLKKQSFSSTEKADGVIPYNKAPISIHKFRATATAYSDGKVGTKEHPAVKFRAPIRTARSDDNVTSYPCSECQRFADLLRSESVAESVIRAAFKHRYFCAPPTNTPPNLWEPWDLNMLPLSATPATQEARDM